MRPSPTPKSTHLALGGLLLILLSLTLVGPAAAEQEAFRTSIQPTGISWEPQTSYDRVELVVSGPKGFYLRRELDSSVTPSLDLAGPADSPMPDGVYSYELRTAPRLDDETRAALRAVRALADPAREAELEAVIPRGAVQAGYFSVAGGLFVDSELAEARTPGGQGNAAAAAELTPMSAQVVLTNANGVIRNSLCVGSDCPNNPVFSDSTILMMENNTRIKFGDTSNSPFPNNDWEIEANSNLSGGASYLGFNDCGTADNDGGCTTDLVFAVEAGARQSALYVESDGDVGLGTSNPAVDLHVVTGNTPTLRLQQDGSSGFAQQTWDVAGNETNFFIRDVTGGSALPFRIRPGAPSSSVYIAASGDVGLGTASPDEKLHLSASGDVAFLLDDTSAGGESWLFKNNTANGAFVVTAAASGGNAPFKVFPGAPENTLVVGNAGGAQRVGIGTVSPAGTLDVNGAIFQRGGVLHADYVFAPGYQLRSIEDQAAFMWQNGHLPAIPQRQVDESGQEIIEIGSHRRGLVEELEKAHIYIEQLNTTLQELRAESAEKDRSLASLEQRLARIEASLAAPAATPAP